MFLVQMVIKTCVIIWEKIIIFLTSACHQEQLFWALWIWYSCRLRPQTLADRGDQWKLFIYFQMLWSGITWYSYPIIFYLPFLLLPKPIDHQKFIDLGSLRLPMKTLIIFRFYEVDKLENEWWGRQFWCIWGGSAKVIIWSESDHFLHTRGACLKFHHDTWRWKQWSTHWQLVV